MSSWPEHSIAVIGMAGRFPGAHDIDEFWRNLRNGRESIRHFSDQELQESSLPDSLIRDPNYVKARGLIDDSADFDAAFFGLGPRQASILDPQQRVWLECVHDALEDAGKSGQSGDETVGVFAGARESTYLLNHLCVDRDSRDRLLSHAGADAYQVFISNDRDSVATRTSYLFDFTGPSVNVQSACSTSLVAVAQACLSLSNYQCDVCIAGGVCVTFPEIRGYLYQEGGFHSPDGRCRAFDARGLGTVFGDGVGAVVLKRLEDALRDGNRIDAVIRGWAVNNDGMDKASFTAPSASGQAEVIALALALAGVNPAEVGYVEAHGTGTQVGDPIEVAGLTQAFRGQTQDKQFCGLGSVKTNIGHLDTAAGIAGFIKTVLTLKHQELPPSLHFEVPNPQIDFVHSPFYVVDRLREWKAEGAGRIAGVSALGVGGTNCHLVIQEAPTQPPTDGPDRPAYLLTLSAKSEQALRDLTTRYVPFLSSAELADLRSISFTTHISRSRYDWRLSVCGETAAEVRTTLARHLDNDNGSGLSYGLVNHGESPVVGFLFTGQGVQYSQMTRQLYEVHSEFRHSLDHCEELLRPSLDRPLLEILYSDGDAGSLLNRTDYTQPALFAVEYALAQLWRSWGIEPAWVMGHSVGEYVAACVAGVFDLPDALTLVAERGRLMNALPRDGCMLDVFVEPERVEGAVRSFANDVVIAAINAPQNVVISGACESVHAMAEQFRKEGIQYRELEVSHAFHSPLMEPVLKPINECVEDLQRRLPRIGFVSNLSGDVVTADLTTGAYWSDQSRQPVRLAAGFRALAREGCNVFVEIGPNAVMTRFGRQTLPDRDVLWISSLRRGESDWRCLLEALGELYVRGLPIDWPAVNRGHAAETVRLPTYPFQRQRYWVDDHSFSEIPVTTPVHDDSVNPMLGERLRLPGTDEIRFETHFSRLSPSYLEDHRLFDTLVVPGASHVAQLVQAAESVLGRCACRFEQLLFLRPMVLPEDASRILQLVLSTPSEELLRGVKLMSAPVGGNAYEEKAWLVHVSGEVKDLAERDPLAKAGRLDLDRVRARARETISADEFYTNIWGNAAGIGSAFRWIDSIWKGKGEAIARTLRPSLSDQNLYYRVHPGVIEAAFQVIHCCRTFETAETINTGGEVYVPFSIDEFCFYAHGALENEVWCYAKIRDFEVDNVVVDLCLTDDSGNIVAEMVGLCLRKLTRTAVIEKRVGDPDLGGKKGPREPSKEGLDEGVVDLLQSLSQVSEEEQTSILTAYFQRQCAKISDHAESKFDPATRLLALGFDSLMAIMLANRIKEDLRITVPIGRLLSNVTIGALGEELHRLWLARVSD